MKVFKISVRSDFEEWSRYNVFLTAVCSGEAGGEATEYVNALADEPLITPPCESAELYIYVVAREFPESRAIADSPPFDISVVVSADGDQTLTTYKVNQFGGLSVRQTLR